MRDKDRQRIIALIDDSCVSESQRQQIQVDIPMLKSIEIALRGNIIERFEKAFPKEQTPGVYATHGKPKGLGIGIGGDEAESG